MNPFDICDISMPPHRLVIGPKHLFPDFVDTEPERTSAELRSFLMSVDMFLGGAQQLRECANRWPQMSMCISPQAHHSDVVNFVMAAVDDGRLIGTVAHGSDAMTVTDSDIRSAGNDKRLAPGHNSDGPVAGMGFTDKLVKALEYVPEEVGKQLGAAAKAEIEGLFSTTNILITAGILAVWAGSHAVGVGFIVDGVLLGVGLLFAGWEAIRAFELIGDFFGEVKSANSEAQLEAAAGLLAAAIAILGVAGFKALLRKVTPKSPKGGGQTGSTSPSSRGGSSSRKRSRSQSGGGDASGSETPASKRAKPSDGDDTAAAPAKKPKKVPKRRQYLGETPRKTSKTGREVRERMRKNGLVRKNRRTGKDEFKGEDGNWYPVDSPNTHMGHHPEDAVDYWNRVGRHHGAKSKEVREWMLDSKNYRFEYGPLNSSRGGATKSRYLPPTN